MRGLSVLCAATAFTFAGAAAGADAAAVPLDLARLTAGGEAVTLPTRSSAVRVFVFLTGECPVSAAYLPTLNGLAGEWRSAGGVEIYGVFADWGARPEAVARFAQEHEIAFPLLLDRDGELARRFGPTHVPEAFVLGRDGRLAYRGRIDDAYAELGRRRPEPTERTLADAVADARVGRAVAPTRTEPVGCLLEPPGGPAPDVEVTFTRDVAPILFANCVVCHREGEVGPFPLVSYADAAKRARQIALVAEKRLMPPWMPAERHGEFLGQRTLTDREITTLKVWAEGGKAEGDAADVPPVPRFTPGWRLGEPDLVVEMPEPFEVPADGPDVFRNFVIPLDVPEDKVVAAVDVRPGNPRVLHHVVLFLDSNGAARKLDAAAPGPGYESFGGAGFPPTGAIGGWSPGNTPRRLPGGMGRYLQKGSDLVVQAHYHPTGKPETDRSKVGIYFVEKPKNVVAGIWAASYEIDLPPGEAENRVSASYTLPNDVTLVGVVPHMHLLGRSVKAEAVLPGGGRRRLITVPDWNYVWQDEYYYADPFRLPKGTRLEVEAVFDNSAENPSNPSSPPRRVTWGEGTLDEMLYCFFLVAVDDPRDLIPLIFDNLAHDAKQPRAH